MKLSSREIVLGVATLSVALFGGTALLARPKFRVWKDMRARQAELRSQIELDRRLVAQREGWDKKLSEVSKLLPVQPAGKKMHVHWLSIMDRLAAKHGVTIRKRQAGEEKRQGDVYELPIECRDWEGSLESIVNFLFELQSEGAMLDIRQLLIKPKGKNTGQLRGRFTLYCAYTRQK